MKFEVKISATPSKNEVTLVIGTKNNLVEKIVHVQKNYHVGRI